MKENKEVKNVEEPKIDRVDALIKELNSKDDITLYDSINLMTDPDVRVRFIAEYIQICVRYRELSRVLIKFETKTLEQQLRCPMNLLAMMKSTMENYIHQLEVRAEFEGVKLPRI